MVIVRQVIADFEAPLARLYNQVSGVGRHANRPTPPLTATDFLKSSAPLAFNHQLEVTRRYASAVKQTNRLPSPSRELMQLSLMVAKSTQTDWSSSSREFVT